MTAEAAQVIMQLGIGGVLLVVLFALWGEYQKQSAFIRDLLTQAEAERKVLAQKVGMTTQDLAQEAAKVRAEMAR